MILLIAYIPLSLKYRIPQKQIGLLHTLTYTSKSTEERNFTTRDDFNFSIVNFPLICSNIPAAPALWNIYLSDDTIFQSLWFLSGFVLDRGLLLTRKLLNQGFLLVKLKSSLRKYYGRHHDLVDRCGISVSQMTTDMFHLSSTLPGPFLIHDM